MKLNRSAEDYLRTMLVLKMEKGTVRSSDVAKCLNVTKQSVSRAVRCLREDGFLTMGPDKEIVLTRKGLRMAKRIYERNVFIRQALESLGIEPRIAGQDACRLEHDLSDTSFEKLKELWERHAAGAV